MVAGIPAAAPPTERVAPDRGLHSLCFTSGSVTYRLHPRRPAPDFRVRIDDTAPDIRVALVDRAEIADFALVDDAVPSDACRTAGRIKTVAIVPGGRFPMCTVSLAHDGRDADFSLFVHSARVTQQDAAALFALMRHMANRHRLAQAR